MELIGLKFRSQIAIRNHGDKLFLERLGVYLVSKREILESSQPFIAA